MEAPCGVAPPATTVGHMSSSLVFSEVVRAVSAAARRAGVTPPVFRSPPPEGVARSIRRGGTVPVVSIRVDASDWERVTDDVVAGLLAAAGDSAPPELADAARAAAASALARCVPSAPV